MNDQKHQLKTLFKIFLKFGPEEGKVNTNTNIGKRNLNVFKQEGVGECSLISNRSIFGHVIIFLKAPVNYVGMNAINTDSRRLKNTVQYFRHRYIYQFTKCTSSCDGCAQCFSHNINAEKGAKYYKSHSPELPLKPPSYDEQFEYFRRKREANDQYQEDRKKKRRYR